MILETVILLTACVNPNGMSYTVLQDRNIRLQQYIQSLQFYLNKTTIPIVFCENSNYDISKYFEHEIKSNRLEVLTFDGNDFEKTRGKGYGEALIIDYALNNSRLLKLAKRVVKITGRLIVENITDLLRTSKCEKCIYADLVKSGKNSFVCSSVCFIAPILFLNKYFLSDKEFIDDSKSFFFEHLLFNKCKQWKSDGHAWHEFGLPVFIKGLSGSTGKEYTIENKKILYIKKKLKLFTHRLIILR